MVQSVCSVQLLQQAILGISHRHPGHYSPRPIHSIGWGRLYFLYGSRIAGAHHTFTSPYPMPFTCITLLWIRGPRHYFSCPPSPPSLLTITSEVSTVISAPNSKPRLFLNHFQMEQIYLTSKKLETPESIPSTLLPWTFQHFTSFWLLNT